MPPAPAALAGSALDPRGQFPRRYSAMLQYATSEFGRFRLQYSRDNTVIGPGQNQYLLQYTVSLGAHGAHPY